MQDNKGDDERRSHFRVRMDLELAIGPARLQLLDDPAFVFRLRHADAVDGLLEVRSAAEPVLAEAVNQGIEYMVALQDLLLARSETLVCGERPAKLSVELREINLSEGGIGIAGAPPCELGEELTAVLIARDHPSRRPIPVRIRLVRIQHQGDSTFLGFEFVEMVAGVKQLVVELIYRTQRRQIREARKP